MASWGDGGRRGKHWSLPADRFDTSKAIRLIAGTQFPLPEGMTLTPEEGILRGADFWHTATLNNEDWLQVQAGLARELKVWLKGNADYYGTDVLQVGGTYR